MEIGYTLPAARRIIHAAGRLQGLGPAVEAAQWLHLLCPCTADRSKNTDKGCAHVYVSSSSALSTFLSSEVLRKSAARWRAGISNSRQQ